MDGSGAGIEISSAEGREGRGVWEGIQGETAKTKGHLSSMET